MSGHHEVFDARVIGKHAQVAKTDLSTENVVTGLLKADMLRRFSLHAYI